jgi:hypothetical protein
MKELGEQRNEVYFIWRNLVSTYNLTTKEFKFEQDNMYIVPWEDYPEDMKKFIDWVMVCQQHKDEVRWTKFDGAIIYPEPKTVEMY